MLLIAYIFVTLVLNLQAAQEESALDIIILHQSYDYKNKPKPYAARAALGFHKQLDRVIYFYDAHDKEILFGVYDGSHQHLDAVSIARFGKWIDRQSLHNIRNIPIILKPFEVPIPQNLYSKQVQKRLRA